MELPVPDVKLTALNMGPGYLYHDKKNCYLPGLFTSCRNACLKSRPGTTGKPCSLVPQYPGFSKHQDVSAATSRSISCRSIYFWFACCIHQTLSDLTWWPYNLSNGPLCSGQQLQPSQLVHRRAVSQRTNSPTAECLL